MTLDKEKLLQSKQFCMLPWTHLHVLANGDVLPCGAVDIQNTVGNLRQERLRTIWNNSRMQQLRKNMLACQDSSECSRCYQAEAQGASSLRQKSNRDLVYKFDKVLETKPDGSVYYFELPYLDIRFSNHCNVSCRTCSPSHCDSVYEEHCLLFGKPEQPKHLQPKENSDDLWREVRPLLPFVEEINFAGGEPLEMPEHYRILDYLLEKNMTNVQLRYSTSFASLEFEDKNIIDYWKQFANVHVEAKLDGMGELGSFLRKGPSWDLTEKMIYSLQQNCSHVQFRIQVKVSALNIFQLVDFHRHCVLNNLIKVDGMNFVILANPPEFCIDVLPAEQKALLRRQLNSYAKELTLSYGTEASAIASSLNSIIQYMEAQDRGQLLPKLRQLLRKQDYFRKENSIKALPHLWGLDPVAVIDEFPTKPTNVYINGFMENSNTL